MPTILYTADDIMKRLTREGIQHTFEESKEPLLYDDQINLDNGLHIQVSSQHMYYYSLNHWDGESLTIIYEDSQASIEDGLGGLIDAIKNFKG